MADKKAIFCEGCSGLIKNKEELCVTTHFITPVAYHDRCFSKAVKGVQTIFVGNEPINSFSGNLKALIALVAAIVLLFLAEGPIKLAGILLLITPVLRLISWLTYERHLDKE